MTDMYLERKVLAITLVKLFSPSAANCIPRSYVQRYSSIKTNTFEERLHLPSLTEPPNNDPLSKASFHVKVKQSCRNRERLWDELLLFWHCFPQSRVLASHLPGFQRRETWARQHRVGHSICREKEMTELKPRFLMFLNPKKLVLAFCTDHRSCFF